MYKDSLITLDNGFQMYVIDEVEVRGRKFILGSAVDMEQQTMDDEDLILKEIIKEDGVDKIVPIEDENQAILVGEILATQAGQ